MTSEAADVDNWLAEVRYYAEQNRKPGYCTSEAEHESDWRALEARGVRPTPRETPRPSNQPPRRGGGTQQLCRLYDDRK
jgi:hypothetical protein